MVTKLVQKETEGKETERMEKENRQRRKRNKKDIRNAFVMLCVTIAMMSTATFAWFTMTDSPTVQGLKMTAASVGGLELKDADEEWKGAITVVSDLKTLSPVSTFTGQRDSFGSPVYTNGEVTNISAINASDLSTKYVAVYDYKIRAVNATGDTSVGLLGGNGSTEGSFIISEDTTTASEKAAFAIRVGFLVNNNTWIIYEPNTNGTVPDTTKKAVNKYTGQSSTVWQKTDGKFTNAAGTAGTTSNDTSGELFKLPANTEYDIKMYIWLEGTDDQCVNEIQTDSLKGQIQFTVIK